MLIRTNAESIRTAAGTSDIKANSATVCAVVTSERGEPALAGSVELVLERGVDPERGGPRAGTGSRRSGRSRPVSLG